MTEDINTTYESAASSDLLRDCLHQLTAERLFNDLGLAREVTIEDGKLRRAAWIASLLANSDDNSHRQLALSFAVLAYHHADGQTTELYRNYLQTVMSRLGNVPVAQQYFDNDRPAVTTTPSGPEDPEDGVPATLKYEIQGTEAHYTVETTDEESEVNEGSLVLTQFQKRVWQELVAGGDTAFSGPTSSGKSFLVQRYLEYFTTTTDHSCCLYLVPSRALIAEVSSELVDELPEEVDVRTEVMDATNSDGTVVYVLTPERTLGLLDSADEVTVDFCFVDEIQSVEKSSRGPLFEYVLDAIIAEWPEAQIVGAGPFIENVSDPISDAKQYVNDSSAEETDTGEIETTYSPVYRLQSEFTFERHSSQVQVNVGDQTETQLDLEIDRPDDVTFNKAKGNRKETIRAFAELYRGDDPLLVYAKTVSRTEDIAERIASDRETDAERFPALVSFLEEELTESYPLIDCLQSGVAYHHGGVPPFARSEIEALYRRGEIDTIVSTTTLLEGVNLPAGKILVVDHKVGGGENERPLSPFQLQNLVGRVGRVGKRLRGQVLYVDHEDDQWASEHIGGIRRKQIEPVTTQTLGKYPDAIVNLLKVPLDQVPAGKKRSTAVFLKSRFLINPEQTRRFILYRLEQSDEPEVENYLKGLVEKLEELRTRLDIPLSVVEQNPSVDPDIQDSIFTAVRDDPSAWVLDHEGLASRLPTIVEQLDRLASFTPDHNRDPTGEARLGDTKTLANLAVGWLQEKSYRTLATHIDSGDVSEVLRVLRQDVRYLLCKYFKVVGDALEYVDTEHIDTDVLEFTRQLHLLLEHGTTSRATLQLINLGLSRSVALRLSHIENSVGRAQLRRYTENPDISLSPFVEHRVERRGPNE